MGLWGRWACPKRQRGALTYAARLEPQVPQSLLPGARAGDLVPAPRGPLRLCLQPLQAPETVVGPFFLVQAVELQAPEA